MNEYRLWLPKSYLLYAHDEHMSVDWGGSWCNWAIDIIMKWNDTQWSSYLMTSPNPLTKPNIINSVTHGHVIIGQIVTSVKLRQEVPVDWLSAHILLAPGL